ncbi:MAG: hypothetical protein Q9208_005924 [Pyrenodesmia sp. 3 TL-2023]
MFIRPLLRILKPIVAHRRLTQATATLRLSKDVTQEVPCLVGGAPDYSVGISKEIGCALAGRDLGYQDAKVDLIYYDGQHFATAATKPPQCSSPRREKTDRNPQSPRLTLSQEVAHLLDRDNGAKLPAALFHSAELDGSGIALKGTEGGEVTFPA